MVDLILRVVFDDHFEGPEDGQHPRRPRVQVVADGVFQQGNFDDVLPLGNPDHLAEPAYGLRRIAAPAKTGQSRHPGVVPAAHMTLVHELGELALAHHRMAQVQPCELDLLGVVYVQGVEEPVVEGPMVLVLHCADRVGDTLHGVGLPVREVVHWVDHPLIAGAVMRRLQDPVEDGVPHVDIARGHVDFGAQDSLAFVSLAVLHAEEQGQVFLDGAVSVGALDTRLGERAPVLAYLLLVQVVYVGLALLDEVDCEVVELVEVVRCEVEVLAPVPTEPADVLQDAVDELLFLLGGVGVVEAHVAAAAVLLGQPEIEAHGLGVADVKVAVGLGGEACHDVPAEPPRPPVGLHRSPDEVQRCFCFLHSVALVTHADALLPNLYIGLYSSVWEVGCIGYGEGGGSIGGANCGWNVQFPVGVWGMTFD